MDQNTIESKGLAFLNFRVKSGDLAGYVMYGDRVPNFFQGMSRLIIYKQC